MCWVMDITSFGGTVMEMDDSTQIRFVEPSLCDE